ncbi:putative Ig domain-containing protein [uncultured Nocardioides sp.]|uniref:putative Ig domain-containing protein n=1 Tax=uncultured Nocardioides sp. TaxID=198441 RepID=UPI00344CDD16
MTFTVKTEQASATYRGPTSVATGEQATLAAEVRQENDGNPGELSKTTVYFVDTVTKRTLCSTTTVDVDANGVGSASCPWTADRDDRTVGVVVGGGWFADAASTLGPGFGLVVSPPPYLTDVQYSDPVDLRFYATTDWTDQNAQLKAELGNFPLPAGLVLERSGSKTEATWRITGKVTDTPKSYFPTFFVSDGRPGLAGNQTAKAYFNVQPEDATVTYLGPTSVRKGEQVTFKAEVKQPSDGSPGDLSKATVLFGPLCTAPVVVDPTTGVGTASCTYTWTAASDQNLTVALGGSFTGETKAPIRVQKGLTVTGGLGLRSETTEFSDGVDTTFEATSDRIEPALQATATGLPEGLHIERVEGSTEANPKWKVAGTVAGPPDTYNASITIADDNVKTDTATFPMRITVGREKATVSMTSPGRVQKDEKVTLTARVTQETDDSLGNLALATVTFGDGTALCADVPVVVDPEGVGTATCDWTADVDRAIRLEVNGPFTGKSAVTATVWTPKGIDVAGGLGERTATTQYSDGVTTSFEASSDRPSASLSATASGLPDGLRIESNGGTSASPTWQVVGVVDDAPGTYDATVTVVDTNHPTDTASFRLTITVQAEHAKVSYDGPTEVPEGESVLLTAKVTQEGDNQPGDLEKFATVSFGDDPAHCQDVPVEVDEATGIGTATCEWTADQARTLALTVGGRFAGEGSADLKVQILKGLQVTEGGPRAVGTQYSDGVASSYSASSDRKGARLVGTATGLPDGLWLERIGRPASAVWRVQGIVVGTPGTYHATVTITDTHGTDTASFPLRITVTDEDAHVTYTGPTSAATGQTIALGAVVTQDDGTDGDLTTATARFADAATDQTLCVTEVTKQGRATCPLTVVGTRTVTVTLGGRYAGTTGNATVAVPSTLPTAQLPDTVLGRGPGAWLLGPSATFEFGASVAGSSFACTLDGVSAPCTSPYTVTGLKPATHVMTIAAAKDGQTDATPVRVVFSVPQGAKALKANGLGWKKQRAARSYLGTSWQTRGKGRVLVAKKAVRGVRQLALVVGSTPRSGKVKVYLGTKLIGTVNLKGPRADSRVLTLKPFPKARSGKLRIVTLTKKPVRIEGIGIATTK